MNGQTLIGRCGKCGEEIQTDALTGTTCKCADMTNEQQPADQGRGVGEDDRWSLEKATHHLASFGGVDFYKLNNWVTLNPGGVCKLIEALLDRLPEPCRDAMVDSIAMDRRRIMRRAQEIVDKRAAIAAITQPKALPPMEAPMPTIADAEAAIDAALSDALKAVKVLYTMLHKVNLPGFAVADEVAASIVYAQKMRAALSLPRQSEAEPLGYIRDTDAAFLKEKFAGQCTILICQKPQNKKALAIYTTPQPAQADTTPAAHGVGDGWGWNDPNKPKWDSAPDWAKYLTMDRDGAWYWWGGRPQLEGGEWKGYCIFEVAGRTRAIPEQYFPIQAKPQAASAPGGE